MVNSNDPYHLNGYANRQDYLQCMADDYDVPLQTVKDLSRTLGRDEDFDALVVALQDIADRKEF